MNPLPGEDAPLPRRLGGEPVTADEALGVLRRHTRAQANRTGKAADVPETLPSATAPKVATLFRLPPRTMAFVRAKAEAEGATVTTIVEEALEAYARTPPGSRVSYTPPRR